MENEPYSPPTSDVEVHKEVEIPKEVLAKIKGGWIITLVSATTTLFFILFSMRSGEMSELFDATGLFDVAMMFVLAFYIYRKSRVASTIMFCYFIYSKIYIMYVTGAPSGLIVSLVFLVFYFQGMIGTYQYHRILGDFSNVPQ